MKRVLILSYYFPPLGMGGTQRIAGFARHLPQFGWQATVVTVKPVAYYAYDTTLLDSLHAVRIERTESLDPQRLLERLGFGPGGGFSSQSAKPGWRRLLIPASNFLFFPDNKILWNPFAVRTSARILAASPHHAIISSGPPHSTHLAARKLARKFALPWIADFRDGWAGGDFQPNASWLHRRLDAILQNKVLQSATHVTCVSVGLAATLRQAAGEEQPGITTITNGYDTEDFVEPLPRDECFDVVHVGTIGNFAQSRVAIEVFRAFVEEAGLSPGEAKLHFIGADIGGTLAQEITAAGMTDYVHWQGYRSHPEAVHWLRRADLLLFLAFGNPNPAFIPGKTFEYLAARRPVLAICPPIEAVTILQETEAVRWVLPENLQDAVAALKAFYVEFMKGEEIVPLFDTTEPYARLNLTQSLAQILDTIAAKKPG